MTTTDLQLIPGLASPNDSVDALDPTNTTDAPPTTNASSNSPSIDTKAFVTALTNCRAPAIVGLTDWSIEHVGMAIDLARKIRGKLIPYALNPTPSNTTANQDWRRPVSMQDSLDQVANCELIIWVGCDGNRNSITQWIVARQLRAAFVKPDLDSVLNYRRTFGNQPDAEPLGQYTRIAVVLDASVESHVASQWHHFAAERQNNARIAVLTLPDDHAANTRGMHEIMAWRLGATGPTDFADGSPKPCADLHTLLDIGAIDFMVFAGCCSDHISHAITRNIPILTLPPSRIGHVMRFDGIMLPFSTTGHLDNDPLTVALTKITGELS